MLGKGGMAQLMQQAQQMQQRMQAVQASVAKMEVTGESGAGLVKITLNGAYQCRSVVIDKSLLTDDQEMLEDLITAAFNDTVRRVKALEEQKMAQVSGDFPLPPGFKMPR